VVFLTGGKRRRAGRQSTGYEQAFDIKRAGIFHETCCRRITRERKGGVKLGEEQVKQVSRKILNIPSGSI